MQTAMPQIDWLGRRRRWGVVVPAVGASILPAALLTIVFAQPRTVLPTFLSCWVEILVGPLKYWLPFLMGHPIKYSIHPMAGIAIWIYLTCLLLILSHPANPRAATALMTIIGSVAWYSWVFLAIAAVEY